MIVVDASAVLELLLQSASSKAIGARLFRDGESLHAPQLLDVEVAQVLRRYWLAGDLPAGRGHEAIEDLADFAIRRYPHQPLLQRVWDLRHDLTVYDATYVALAEALDAPLPTLDTRLAKAPGHTARIELPAP